VWEAVVCLLEKSGDVRGAFDIMFERLTITVSESLETSHYQQIEVYC